MAEPAARFYQSQGLRLHYADWGNETAPPLILIHGGLDHCRNWDAVARELQPHFHVVAPDLRGHGDSEWAKGSSYSLSDNVYDLGRLMRHAELAGAAIVGHSMGGMVALTYTGTYPEKVSRLGVLDGAFLSAFATAAGPSADVSMDRSTRRHFRARAQRLPHDRGGGTAAFGTQQAADAGAGAASCALRCQAGH